ncbi:MAG: hypothetical protein AAF889_02390 [Cyanobacteria bacterium P01_D01_bin.73]
MGLRFTLILQKKVKDSWVTVAIGYTRGSLFIEALARSSDGSLQLISAPSIFAG